MRWGSTEAASVAWHEPVCATSSSLSSTCVEHFGSTRLIMPFSLWWSTNLPKESSRKPSRQRWPSLHPWHLRNRHTHEQSHSNSCHVCVLYCEVPPPFSAPQPPLTLLHALQSHVTTVGGVPQYRPWLLLTAAHPNFYLYVPSFLFCFFVFLFYFLFVVFRFIVLYKNTLVSF